MSKSLNEIQELFNQSDADPVIVNDLLVFLPILPEEVLEKLLEAFKADSTTINDFVKNFRAKFEALAGQQSASFEDIEDEEADEFNDDFDVEDNFDEEEF